MQALVAAPWCQSCAC